MAKGFADIGKIDRRTKAFEALMLKGSALDEAVLESHEKIQERIASGAVKPPFNYLGESPFLCKEQKEEATPFRRAWIARLGRGKPIMLVTASLVFKGDQVWYHVSFSYASKVPSYQDMTMVKKYWIGPGLPAFQVFPVEAEHVNRHPYCLHLWSPLEFNPLPDFRTLGEV